MPNPTELSTSTWWFRNKLRFRLAWFDLRRYRGYTSYAIAAVTIPVFILATLAGVTWMTGLSPASKHHYETGTTHAALVACYNEQSERNNNPHAAAKDPTFTGGLPVTPVRESRWEHRGTKLNVLATLPAADLGPKAQLTSGTWPTNATEVLVTPSGHQAGIPKSGDVTVTIGTQKTTVTIVGTGTGYANYDHAHLITHLPPDGTTAFGQQRVHWLVTDPSQNVPAALREVPNPGSGAYLTAISQRALTPNPVLGTPVCYREYSNDSDFALAWIYKAGFGTAGILVLLILLGLLVVPALAMSTQRSRRMLAMLGLNGARSNDAKGIVQLQGSIVGLLGVSIGLSAALAVLAAWFAIRGSLPTYLAPAVWSFPGHDFMFLAVTAFLAVVFAARWPAGGIAQDNLVDLTKKRDETPLRAGRLLLGTLGLIFGFIAMVLAVLGGSQTMVAWSAVLYLISVLALVPHLIVWLAKASNHLPRWAHFALRDAARSRSRTTPMIGAVLAATALLTMASFSMSSFQAQTQVTDTPSGFRTTPILWPAKSLGDRTSILNTYTQKISSVAELDVTGQIKAVGTPWRATWKTNRNPSENVTAETFITGGTAPVHLFVADSCTSENVTQWLNNSQTSGCVVLGEASPSSRGKDGVVVVPDEWAETKLTGLTTEQRTNLRAGHMLYQTSENRGRHDFTLVTGDVSWDRAAFENTRNGMVFTRHDVTTSIPTITVADIQQVGLPEGFSGLITDSTAEKLSLPTTPVALALRSNTTVPVQYNRIYELFGAGATLVLTADADQFNYPETVLWERYDWYFIILGILLIAVSCVTVLLNNRELRTQMTIMYTLGASARQRKALVIAQAMGLSVVGMVLGFISGFMPSLAIATALSLRSDLSNAWAFDGPWLWFAGLFVIVPLAVALVTALTTRTRPQTTRRTT